MKIGLIGLGIMGKPMGMNLLKAGHDLMVNNRSRGPMDEMAKAGAIPASKLDIAKSCSIILTMLPDSPDVKGVLLEDEFYLALSKGQTVIDMSSINPIATREIGETLAQKGVDMLDAPVSGGDLGAIEGTLAFMVGGKKEVFEKHKDLLYKMGASVVHCGDLGAGNTTKLVNQIIVAGNIRVLAEGLTLAEKSGVDPKTVIKAISGGLAGSRIMDDKADKMLDGNRKPGFKVDLHLKDLNNVINFAHEIGAYIPLTTDIQEIFYWLKNKGLGQEDNSGIYDFYKQLGK